MNTIDWSQWERPKSYVLAEDLQIDHFYVLQNMAVAIRDINRPKHHNNAPSSVEIKAVTSHGTPLEFNLFPSDLVPELPTASAQYKIDWMDHDEEAGRRRLWLELVEGPSQRFGAIYLSNTDYELTTEILTCWDARKSDGALHRLPARNLRRVEDRVFHAWEEYEVVVTITDVYGVEGSAISNVVVCWAPRV